MSTAGADIDSHPKQRQFPIRCHHVKIDSSLVRGQIAVEECCSFSDSQTPGHTGDMVNERRDKTQELTAIDGAGESVASSHDHHHHHL